MNSNWSYSLETLHWGQNQQLLSCVTLKFDGWPWKTIGHLFYATLSFVHHFKAIGEFKLSYSPETLNLGQNQWFFVPCDLEIWWKTLKNNREPVLYYVKLWASFQSHWWIQTGVTVRKHPIWVKIDDFLSPVTLKFHKWPWKTKGHIFYATSKFCASFRSYGWIKTGVTVQKHPFLVKIDDFF